jgi:hypothetical protein
VGQPDPAHVARIDDRPERVHEAAVRQAQAGVDDERLGGVEYEGVHRQEADTRHRQLVIENADVASEAVDSHSSLPDMGDLH